MLKTLSAPRLVKFDKVVGYAILIILVIMTMEIIMVTEVSAVKLRQNLGEMLNRVQYAKDSIIVKKDGKTVAAIIDPAVFERLRKMENDFDALRSKLSTAYADVPEEEGMAEVQRLIDEERGKR